MQTKSGTTSEDSQMMSLAHLRGPRYLHRKTNKRSKNNMAQQSDKPHRSRRPQNYMNHSVFGENCLLKGRCRWRPRAERDRH